MTSLADTVLPMIRTRADLHRWSAASGHGKQMWDAIDLLEAAIPDTPPREAYSVTHRALTSAVKVIARADDSSGMIGLACKRLLALHPMLAAAAKIPAARLVDWMMTFQFEGDVDYFEIDPVAYAPALGEKGMAAYRSRLQDVRAQLGPEPSDPLTRAYGHERWVLEWNDKRLAVLDHDVNAIIRAHAKDKRVAAWFEDTAEAFEEIGEFELAIDWARQGMDVSPRHQAQKCAETWCRLLDEHHPEQVLQARRLVFDRWPTSSTAAGLREAAGEAWPGLRDHVLAALEPQPRDAVLFALLTLEDPHLAWDLAHRLDLSDDGTWNELITVYQTIDPVAVLPIHARIVEGQLIEANAKRYRAAAGRLATMRKLAAGTDHATAVDDLIADLRARNRNRRRLQQEFDRARLP